MKGRYVWAIVLVMVGLWLLLSNVGLLPGASWGIFWAIVLIIIGVVLIVGVARRGQVVMVDDSVPLGTASAARLHIKHGAGRLQLQGAEGPGHLVWGTFGSGVNKTVQQLGDRLDVVLAMDAAAFADRVASFSGQGRGYEWNVAVNSAVPVDLKLETGASDQHIDLSRVRATRFDLTTGASSTLLVLPAAAGYTEARVSSGAAAIKITVPQGVALRVTGSVGLGSLKVNEARFPKAGDTYESTDFATAPNRVHLTVEGGVGSVEIF